MSFKKVFLNDAKTYVKTGRVAVDPSPAIRWIEEEIEEIKVGVLNAVSVDPTSDGGFVWESISLIELLAQSRLIYGPFTQRMSVRTRNFVKLVVNVYDDIMRDEKPVLEMGQILAERAKASIRKKRSLPTSLDLEMFSKTLTALRWNKPYGHFKNHMICNANFTFDGHKVFMIWTQPVITTELGEWVFERFGYYDVVTKGTILSHFQIMSMPVVIFAGVSLEKVESFLNSVDPECKIYFGDNLHDFYLKN